MLSRGAWLALLAAPLILTAAASAGPVEPGRRAPVWEEHGAGRTDGLSVGAYPLPVQAERGRDVEEDLDGGAKERWVRRHYQWLRALGLMLREGDPEGDGRPGARPAEPPAFAAPDPPHTMRLGDVVVLEPPAAGDDMGVVTHLLDDGGRYEDPEAGRGEALDSLARDRLIVESAKVVAEYFRPLGRGLRGVFGGALDGEERPRPSRPGFAQARSFEPPELLQSPLLLPSYAEPAAPSRPRPPAAPVSMLNFFKQIAADILSAPTTYLLTALALLVWLILRAIVFSRG
jgi:hypothetical protein